MFSLGAGPNPKRSRSSGVGCPVALFHATAETGTTVITVPSESAEEDAAQQEKSKGLPEVDLAKAEEL